MSERRVRRRKPRLKFDKQMYKKLGILFWIVYKNSLPKCGKGR